MLADDLRVLVPGDEARLFALLDRHVETSLFLFSNVERAGLQDRGEPLQATYVGCFDASGGMTAVAGHGWNGNLVVQGAEGLERAAQLAVARSGRPLRGIIGPWAAVCRVRVALGKGDVLGAHDAKELLFSLDLSQLRVPGPLETGELVVRVPTATETGGLLTAWRTDYQVEALGAVRSPDLDVASRNQIDGWLNGGALWVLARAGEIVAMTAFNAKARGIVQVGGVFTPPALRSRGYARAAVAGSLLAARREGAAQSVLFTGEDNLAAQRSYASLGYELRGDFGLVLF